MVAHSTDPWRRQVLIWLLVGLLFAVLLTGGLVALLVWGSQGNNQVRNFFDAQLAWSNRPFQRYRLLLELEGGLLRGACRQEVEVDGEQVVAVALDECGMPATTITELFNRIEPLVTGRVCGPNGCDCDGRVMAIAEYDATLGYPRTLSVEMRKPPLALRWPPWERVSCTMVGFDPGPTIRVLALTPLP